MRGNGRQQRAHQPEQAQAHQRHVQTGDGQHMGESGIAQRRFVVFRNAAAIAGDQRAAMAPVLPGSAARMRCGHAPAQTFDAACDAFAKVGRRAAARSAAARHRQSPPRRCPRKRRRGQNRCRPARPAPAAASARPSDEPSRPGTSTFAAAAHRDAHPRGALRCHERARMRDALQDDAHALAMGSARTRRGRSDATGPTAMRQHRRRDAISRNLASAKPSSERRSAASTAAKAISRLERRKPRRRCPTSPMADAHSRGRLERQREINADARPSATGSQGPSDRRSASACAALPTRKPARATKPARSGAARATSTG